MYIVSNKYNLCHSISTCLWRLNNKKRMKVETEMCSVAVCHIKYTFAKRNDTIIESRNYSGS